MSEESEQQEKAQEWLDAVRELFASYLEETGYPAEVALDPLTNATLARTYHLYDPAEHALVATVGLPLLFFEEMTVRGSSLDLCGIRQVALHEAAHIAHVQEDVWPEAARVATATWWSGLTAEQRTVKVDERLRHIRRGENSSHGPAWKRHAKRLGADPRARY